jgi:DNA-binding NarL/FixJ family response regulator
MIPVTGGNRAGRQIRVAVFEEHELLRHGLVACLGEDPDLAVIVAAADGSFDPGAELAVVSSDAAKRYRFECPIVVCSDHRDGPRSVADGNSVAGVLHRESVTVAQLHATVKAAAAGLRVSPSLRTNQDRLDSRSIRLVELVAEGHSTREIAHSLSYSEQTIKKLINSLEGRLGARSRAQLVALAIRRGLI